MSSGLFERDPTPNPIGDGPSDTNPLLDAIQDGNVIVRESEATITEAWFWADESGRIHRETFAGSPPAVHQDWAADPLFAASKLADSMRMGRSNIRLTDFDELHERRQFRKVALAFRHWRRMEYWIETRGAIDE